jgi:hypothetical protein
MKLLEKQAYSRGNFRYMQPKIQETPRTNLIFCLIRNKLAIQVAWRILLIMTLSLY